jgi:hypothetical protein
MLAGWRLRVFAGRVCRGGRSQHFALGSDPSKASYFGEYTPWKGAVDLGSGVVEYDSSRLQESLQGIWAGDENRMLRREARRTARLARLLRSKSAAKEDVSPLVYEMF